MKKTEKIEIRVSPEEKEALSAASRSEGRNVSDVLREHVRRYVAAATAASPRTEKKKKMTWISKAAYVALGAAVSAPATMYAVADDSPAAPGFEVNVALQENAGQQDQTNYRAKTRIPLTRTEPTLVNMPSGDAGGFRVAIIKENNDDKTYRFVFSICQETADGCEEILSPGIITAFGGDSSLGVRGAGDVQADIHISSVEG